MVDCMEQFDSTFPVAVVDTSFMVAAIFSAFSEDENKTAVSFLEDLIQNNGQIYVPQLFWFEFYNVLVTASRPKKDGGAPRLTSEEIQMIETILSDYPIYTEPQPDLVTRMRIREIAEKNNLSFYDAAYYELALRTDVPLKTFDKALLVAQSSYLQ